MCRGQQTAHKGHPGFIPYPKAFQYNTDFILGLGDGKNYITVTIPNDNELIQAIYLMRLPSGMLTSYEVIELMPSGQMSEALKRSKQLIENDTTLKN